METLTLDQVHHELTSLSREKDVLNQGFELGTSWWRDELRRAGMEVLPPLGGDSTSIYLDRRTLFALASEVIDGSRDPRDFTFHVLLWGSGTTRRNNRGRIDSLIAPTTSPALLDALQAAQTSPSTAFDAFRSRGRNTFAYLGPAYFTKLMYFAGQGRPTHPALIVDRRVLATLAGTEPGSGLSTAANYPRETYLRACSALEAIAASARDSGHPELTGCTADLVERWAFGRAALN
ncbi:hypothetical protein SA2016_1260 [Sinomonas atrocyanea]|uniref:Uncharacterized protein n=1 Tax=Sinomonas atrocyanea TaxID=37927 RepID=A0A126ZXP4_9MICC|nr:hypothetical protein [Sinomonas atrocyanea]AMM31940.1 hypothetical protein SA2016_1260 [Sinomonas atrocyanea]GEB65975.1 hypothetical protein SAT01_34230 [Sinomonas atrocyanea]GGG65878.1 hypothetical protein GCM10007172_16720 [Sinomonas atrocyanea]